MLNLNHKSLEVWRKSIQLITGVYKATNSFPREEKFGLVSQMRRASVSIASNISEGASRSSSKERKRFYEIARSSLVELDTQLEISLKLQFISKPQIKVLGDLMNEVFAMLTAMKAKT
ncbi:MAG TPA: four helix bundle protein [Balneolaceae bacterium]|nr:four helix bundle protein [Balneolaceae bacterium]